MDYRRFSATTTPSTMAIAATPINRGHFFPLVLRVCGDFLLHRRRVAHARAGHAVGRRRDRHARGVEHAVQRLARGP